MRREIKMETNKQNTSLNFKRIINLIPGDLIYKGSKTEKFSIEKYSFNQNFFSIEEFDSCDNTFCTECKNKEDDTIQWINVTGINHVEEIKKIGEIYQIDAMILEQILNINKHGIYKFTEDYIFNDMQMIYVLDGKFYRENISFYFKNNTILTFQEKKGDVFNSIRERLTENQGFIRNKTVEYTYFCLLDALIDHYLFALEEMKSRIELMEIKLMDDQKLDNKELHKLRKRIMMLRISASPIEKSVMEILESPKEKYKAEKKYFDSLLQHIRAVIGEVTIQKETMDGLYENYMMTNANDMNHIMTILTVFSAIFIPLSFLAGVFGMNFRYMPMIEEKNGFLYFVFVGIGLALLMFGYFKKKKWF